MAKGLTRYFTGVPCKNGHIAERMLPSSTCIVCNRERASAWGKANPGLAKERTKQWKRANPDKVKTLAGRYRDKNRQALREKHRAYNAERMQTILERCRQYREQNPDKRKATQRAYRQANPDKGTADAAKRRSALLQRTAPWADYNIIRFFYATRTYLAKDTGSEWHVDHVVPLRGRRVSGLHTHHNLVVVPALENIRKGSKF